MTEITNGLRLTQIISTGDTNLEDMPVITGVTTDALSPIRKVVGTEIDGPGVGVKLYVNVKKDHDGKVKFHMASNGSKYAWVDVALIEEGVTTTYDAFTRVAHGRFARLNWQSVLVDGGRHTKREIVHNWLGTTARIYHFSDRSTIICSHAFEDVDAPFTETEYPFSDMVDTVTRGQVSPMKGMGRLIYEGFRVFVYDKEEGIEITTQMPSIKSSHTGKWVRKYKGIHNWITKLLVPGIELVFLRESGIRIAKRKVNAACADCMSCYTDVTGQYQVDPSVSCTIGKRHSISFDPKWQDHLDRSGMVALGNSVYIMHSEEADDITCLPKSAIHMDHRFASNRGRVGYEFASWFASTEKCNEVIGGLYKAMVDDLLFKGVDRLMAIAMVFGKDIDKAYKWLKSTEHEDLGIVYHRMKLSPVFYDMVLSDFLYDEESHEVEIVYKRFDTAMDVADMDEDVAFTYDNTTITYQGSPQKDNLPSWDRIYEVTNGLNPLVAALLLEFTVSKEDSEMFPLTLRTMEEFIQAESNPRMKRVGSTKQYLTEPFEEGDPCVWFRYKGSKKPAYGLTAHLV